MSVRWKVAGSVVMLTVVLGLWFLQGGRDAVSWTFTRELAFEPGGLSLNKSSEFALGFKFDSRDPTGWIAAGSETAGLMVAYDAQEHALRLYSLENPMGGHVFSFGGEGMLDGQFMRPHGLAIGIDGSMWVADELLPVIRQYSSNGELLTQSNPVSTISGWQDVCVLPDGRVALTAVIRPDLSGPGVYLFGPESSLSRLRAGCLGSLACDDDGNIYILNHQFRSGRSPRQSLLSLDAEGRTRFELKYTDSWLRPDITYWSARELLLVVNSGQFTIEGLSPHTRSAQVVLDLRAEPSPPIAVVVIGHGLLVVFCDGTAHLYEAD